MPWTTFLESLDAWRGADVARPGGPARAAFAAYLADRHDLTRTEAQEVIEDWAALTHRALALSP